MSFGPAGISSHTGTKDDQDVTLAAWLGLRSVSENSPRNKIWHKISRRDKIII
jgi:hypothetical protein